MHVCRKQLKENVGIELFHAKKWREKSIFHIDAQQIPFFYLSPWYQVYKCERKRGDGGNKPSSMKGNRYGTLDINRTIRIIQLFLVVALKASK